MIYFQYETTTDVSFEVKCELYLPGITFCGNKYDFISQSFKDKYLNASEEIDKLTIKEQFDNLIQPENISNVVQCDKLAIRNFDPDVSKDCNQVSMARIAINQIILCFSLFVKMSDDDDDAFKLDTSSDIYSSGYLAKLTYLHNTIDFYLMVHNRKEKEIDYNTKHVLFNNDKNDTLFTFEKVVNNFIDNHGHKVCLKNTGFFSKSECMQVCKINFYRTRYGYLPRFNYLITDRWCDSRFNTTIYNDMNKGMLQHCDSRWVLGFIIFMVVTLIHY